MTKVLAFIFLALISVLMVSCSSGVQNDPTSSGVPQTASIGESKTPSLGYYTVNIDPDTMTASVTENRELGYHMNVEGYLLGWPCGNCLKIKNLVLQPGSAECDIEITHPVNLPVYTVFDLRVIAIFPADEYFGPIGVSYALQNRDGFTNIWDNPSIPGHLNGYKAYNKGDARRTFLPGSTSTEHFSVVLPAGGLRFDIGVDASWMPNDGINFPPEMNSFEVINLEASCPPGLNEDGGSTYLEASMYDYQGRNTIASVKAYSDDLFSMPVNLSFVSGDEYNATYQATAVTNQKLAPAGYYNILVVADDVQNPNYTYEVASYDVINVFVEPVLHPVVITLAEDDAATTPGNYYDMSTYSGAAGSSVINYLDADGPWDFTQLPFTAEGRREAFGRSAPEVAGFVGSFPSATRFVRSVSAGMGEAYQAVDHNYSNNKLMVYGMYESATLGGAVVFTGTPNGFQYPYNTSTNFTVNFSATVQGTSGTATWKTKAVGHGIAKIPLNGGTYKSALLMRTTIDIKVLFISVAKFLLYEWYDDDGNLLGMAGAANILNETANYNESTYEITGSGAVGALNEFYRQ
jgi:hypothetical protein